MADKNLAPVRVDNADQAVSISQDIEHGEFFDLVCMFECGTDVAELVPFPFLSDLDPGAKGFLEFWIDGPSFTQFLPGDQVHRHLRDQSRDIVVHILRRSRPSLLMFWTNDEGIMSEARETSSARAERRSGGLECREGSTHRATLSGERLDYWLPVAGSD